MIFKYNIYRLQGPGNSIYSENHLRNYTATMVDWNWFGPISDSCVICNWKSWTDVASLLTFTVTCPLARLSVSMVSQYQSQVAFNNGTIAPKLSLNCMVYVSVAEIRVFELFRGWLSLKWTTFLNKLSLTGKPSIEPPINHLVVDRSNISSQFRTQFLSYVSIKYLLNYYLPLAPKIWTLLVLAPAPLSW